MAKSTTKKNKAGKGTELWGGYYFMQHDKVTFQYKHEESEGLSHVNIWCKRVPGGRKNKYKNLVMEAWLVLEQHQGSQQS